MRILRLCCLFLICFSSIHALCQQIVSAPEPQPGTIIGTVTDLDEDAIPGATVTLSGDGSDSPSAVTNQDGFFVLKNVLPICLLSGEGERERFWRLTSSVVSLRPGQDFDLADIKLTLAVVETTVSAVSQEQIALEQVKDAEKQRVFGVIPNFYVAYDPNTVPLTAKL